MAPQERGRCLCGILTECDPFLVNTLSLFNHRMFHCTANIPDIFARALSICMVSALWAKNKINLSPELALLNIRFYITVSKVNFKFIFITFEHNAFKWLLSFAFLKLSFLPKKSERNLTLKIESASSRLLFFSPEDKVQASTNTCGHVTAHIRFQHFLPKHLEQWVWSIGTLSERSGAFSSIDATV